MSSRLLQEGSGEQHEQQSGGAESSHEKVTGPEVCTPLCKSVNSYAHPKPTEEQHERPNARDAAEAIFSACPTPARGRQLSGQVKEESCSKQGKGSRMPRPCRMPEQRVGSSARHPLEDEATSQAAEGSMRHSKQQRHQTEQPKVPAPSCERSSDAHCKDHPVAPSQPEAPRLEPGLASAQKSAHMPPAEIAPAADGKDSAAARRQPKASYSAPAQKIMHMSPAMLSPDAHGKGIAAAPSQPKAPTVAPAQKSGPIPGKGSCSREAQYQGKQNKISSPGKRSTPDAADTAAAQQRATPAKRAKRDTHGTADRQLHNTAPGSAPGSNAACRASAKQNEQGEDTEKFSERNLTASRANGDEPQQKSKRMAQLADVLHLQFKENVRNSQNTTYEEPDFSTRPSGKLSLKQALSPSHDTNQQSLYQW